MADKEENMDSFLEGNLYDYAYFRNEKLKNDKLREKGVILGVALFQEQHRQASFIKWFESLTHEKITEALRLYFFEHEYEQIINSEIDRYSNNYNIKKNDD